MRIDGATCHSKCHCRVYLDNYGFAILKNALEIDISSKQMLFDEKICHYKITSAQPISFIFYLLWICCTMSSDINLNGTHSVHAFFALILLNYDLKSFTNMRTSYQHFQ